MGAIAEQVPQKPLSLADLVRSGGSGEHQRIVHANGDRFSDETKRRVKCTWWNASVT